ncbi:cobalamin-dependent protein [Metabacillus sp. GX 13764]|uniref:cobalamin B12-binding domain-containing protein n=1 Tax=Metabacillus kandeliae TaxID=2900151 RepID=UPI001E56304E|nr:B12-binding domain-containing protein [Metabacillus kandeliae]MCD7036509.1 cobalamin-dependent protein [Metabacillus kandeliae]
MTEVHKKLAFFFLDGDHASAWEIVKEDLAAGKNTMEIFEELFTPAMGVIGEMWEDNSITVADEHLATSTCDFVLSRYQHDVTQKRKDPQNGRKALFLCVQDENHYLGLKMIDLLFKEKGWTTKFLGCNLPLEYAVSAAEKWKPDVIGLSFTTAYRVSSLAGYIEQLEALDHRPTVLLGGRLVPLHDFKMLCSEHTKLIPSLEDLNGWLNYGFSRKEQIPN